MLQDILENHVGTLTFAGGAGVFGKLANLSADPGYVMTSNLFEIIIK